MLAINGTLDHLHILIGLHPSQAISGLVRDIKANTNEWINKKRWIRGRLLAGGLWRIFLFPVAARPSRQMRHPSEGAPRKTTLQRRVSDSVAEIRHRV